MNGFAALDIHPHRRYVVDIGGRRSSRCRLHTNLPYSCTHWTLHKIWECPDFRQSHADEIAKYEEALQFLKQNSPDGKLPTMKELRPKKEMLTQQKNAQYETYQYFKGYYRELQTVCSNVENILDQPSVQKHATHEFTL